MVKVIFVLLMGFLVMSWARADVPISCLPEATSLQSFEVTRAEGSEKSYELKTLRFGQLKPSEVDVRISQNFETKSLQFSFAFQQEDIVSLPFNIYAIMISMDSGPVVWKDLTRGCRDPGIGFYPGQRVELEPIPFPASAGESYRVMIWGQK
tara:strand:+ start:2017 stop:2472 length:456 start_codon:yes stop_codon:yes gene_type:complete